MRPRVVIAFKLRLFLFSETEINEPEDAIVNVKIVPATGTMVLVRRSKQIEQG